MIPNEKAMALARALDEKGALDLTTLALKDAAFTDFFVIATGTSERHVHSLADTAVEAARQLGVRPLGVEGARGSRWTLVDLGDVVVHIFLREARDFYALERLWADLDAPEPATEATG